MTAHLPVIVVAIPFLSGMICGGIFLAVFACLMRPEEEHQR
jgi:hypothetical protein